MASQIDDLQDELVRTAHAVMDSGAISMSRHGNASLRVPGRDEMIFTAGGSLAGFSRAGVARIGLDGTLLEGNLPPLAGAVVDMHTAIYRERADAGCVIHTHSPYATAFAVANQPIECWTEAFGIFGLYDGVPVAGYGPRGSKQSVDNIRDVLGARIQAVLLANHGVLAWHRTAPEAINVGVIVEEAAQSAIYAAGIGGAKAIPPELLHASQERAASFEATGTRHG
ncbi:MAG: class II aldolase/adducin family protein [Candidatus Dormibacteraeota bacterium]|nr:class II aldolase/adducin family protein [Candidatus Dormibacteraeota bacterium]